MQLWLQCSKSAELLLRQGPVCNNVPVSRKNMDAELDSIVTELIEVREPSFLFRERESVHAATLGSLAMQSILSIVQI